VVTASSRTFRAVAVGRCRQEVERLAGDVRVVRAQAALVVGQGALQYQAQLRRVERLQHHDPAAGQERRVDLERRVLGGGADQHHVARLDVREQRVLLRLVVAVDLVDEHDGASLLALAPYLGVAQHLAQLLDAREHGAHRLEVVARAPADHVGERRLARAGRAPQDHRALGVGLDRPLQRLARRQDVLLAQHLLERARPHAVGERRVGPHAVGSGSGLVGEEHAGGVVARHGRTTG
jgi:hypothetical protein